MKLERIIDAGEKFADRYVCEFDNGDVYNLSANANQPNGVCMYVGNVDEGTAGVDDNAPEVACKQAPEGTRRMIERLENEQP